MNKPPNKSKPCNFLDTKLAKAITTYPKAECRCQTASGCPKKKKKDKRHLNWMCWRMG